MRFEDVFSFNNLYASYKKCLKGVIWKGTVQYFDSHAPTELVKIKNELDNGTLKTGNFFTFTRMERGKLRLIKSVKIKERVVQRCLCDYCLCPMLSKYFIYDNSACVKGKGVHFAQNRFKYHLLKYFKKYKNNNGYILQFDMHHYFETIPHQKLIDKVSKIIKDEKIIKLYSQLINDFEGTKGIGLGSQVSQISALFYMSEIDHKIIKQKNVVAYARYMDDGYVISNSKNVLLNIKELFSKLVQEFGLKINKKKTIIRKLDQTITFLKCRYNLLNSGKVIMRIAKSTIVRNRRKLKKLFKLNKDFKLIDNYVKSVVGNWKKYNAYKVVENYLLLYNELRIKYNCKN